MTEPLGLSALWAETLATFRHHRTILVTLAAAFIFLPQFAATLALEAAGVSVDLGAMLRAGPGGIPDFPVWFGPLNIALFLVQLLALIPVTRITLGLFNPDETVGAMIADAAGRLPGILKALLVLVLLYVVLLIAVLVPLTLVLVVAGLIATVVVGGLGYALGAVGGIVGEGFGRLLAAVVNGAFAALISLLYYIFIAHLYRRLAT
jgi:hypothetical protein